MASIIIFYTLAYFVILKSIWSKPCHCFSTTITHFLLISLQVNTSPSILEYRATIHKGLTTFESPPPGGFSPVSDTMYLNTNDLDGDLNVLFKTSFQTGALPDLPPYIKKATIGLTDVSVTVDVQGVYRGAYFHCTWKSFVFF